MSAYLKTLKSFQVISNVTNDDVLDDGEIIQHTSKVDLLAAKPDRLRVEVTSDDRHRLYLYDGKDFTVWARLVNYYATVPAPGTIGQLLDEASREVRHPISLCLTSSDGETTTTVPKSSHLRSISGPVPLKTLPANTTPSVSPEWIGKSGSSSENFPCRASS